MFDILTLPYGLNQRDQNIQMVRKVSEATMRHKIKVKVYERMLILVLITKI